MAVAVFVQVTLLLAVLLATAFSQVITVPFTIDGKPTNMRLTSQVDPVEAAKYFCRAKASELNLSNDNFMSCVNPVAVEAKKHIDNFVAERNTITVPVPIEDKIFDVSFRLDRTSPADMARKLCTENAQLLNITDMNACVTPVANYILERSNEYLADRSIEVPLSVNNVDLSVKFRLDLQTMSEMARKVCVEQADKIGITKENLDKCLTDVEVYINDYVMRNRGQIKVPITVDGKTFTATLRPTAENAAEASRRLCLENKDSFGLKTDEELTLCVNNVFTYIVRWYNETILRVKA